MQQWVMNVRGCFNNVYLLRSLPSNSMIYFRIHILLQKYTHYKTEHFDVYFSSHPFKCNSTEILFIVGWMIKRLGQLCPKIVRVYGRSIEAVDFPIPGKSFLSKKSTHNAKPDDELRSVALHHLIRKKGKPNAEIIKAFDQNFKKKNYEADPEAVKKYLKMIREASVDELKKHEVILCTTAVGSNPKIRDGTDIFQV